MSARDSSPTTATPTTILSKPPLLKSHPFLSFPFPPTSTKIKKIRLILNSLRSRTCEKPVSGLHLSRRRDRCIRAIANHRSREYERMPTVSRTTKAMHYRLQGGTTKVDFRGTDLLQRASGEAKVEGKKTNFEIDAKFPASKTPPSSASNT